jgi:hypothetical protein
MEGGATACPLDREKQGKGNIRWLGRIVIMNDAAVKCPFIIDVDLKDHGTGGLMTLPLNADLRMRSLELTS